MINEFRGEYRFLSNFWPAPIKYDGQEYPSSEHLYQALKTLDPLERAAVREAIGPGKAKKMGNEITLREDWDEIKIRVMRHVVFRKFAQNLDLAKLLIATESHALVEGNWHGDAFWGVDLKKGPMHGENHLGIILAEIRVFLQWLEFDKEF